MGKQQTAGQIKESGIAAGKKLFRRGRNSESRPAMPLSFAFPISGFHTITLSKIHLSLLFIFIVSLSFAPEILALTATRRYDIATFDHTAGEQ